MPKNSSAPSGGSYTLLELAEFLEGRLEGDPSVAIHGVKGIKEAGPLEITFLANPRYAAALKSSRAAAAIVDETYSNPGLNLIKTANPYLAFAKALRLFHPRHSPPPGISRKATIAPTASIDKEATVMPMSYVSEESTIGPGTVISPFVYVGSNVSIGNGCLIYPNVTIRERVTIGDRVIVHSGSVIGSDGFGYTRDQSGHFKIPQVGGVVIEDDVEIGAGVTIDRGTMGDTRIGRGTKIDNLVQIAHNVIIGDNSIIVAQVGISGSSRLGRSVTLAGQVGVVGHIEIGDNVVVGAQSGVSKSLPPGQAFSGSPAVPHREWLKIQTHLKHLPAMRQEIKRLTKIIEDLEKSFPNGTTEESEGEEQ